MSPIEILYSLRKIITFPNFICFSVSVPNIILPNRLSGRPFSMFLYLSDIDERFYSFKQVLVLRLSIVTASDVRF
jgi:hypothetical protein